MSAAAGERVLAWAWLGTVPYREAWALQSRLAEDRRAGRLADDLVLLLEHPPVYTMGRNGEPRHVPSGSDALRAAGADYVDVDRGGSVTFHGPGQLVAYPIVDLAASFPIAAHPLHGDVVQYLRALEAALIDTAAAYGVRVDRRPPYTGVWAGTAKLAAIGVKLARGVTTHGVALNVCTDLSWFERIVPCGIDGASVASLETLGAPGLTPQEVAPRLAAKLAQAFGARGAEADARTQALLAAHTASAAAAA
jgi:lipoyl(octanoyl) transferase